MRCRITAAKKIANAKSRHLDATLELLRYVERWNHDLKGWELDRQRKSMFEAAQRYAATLDRLTRARK